MCPNAMCPVREFRVGRRIPAAQPRILKHHDAVAIADRDPSRLLPAVLQCEHPVEGEFRHLLTGSPDPKPRTFGFGRQRVGRSSVAHHQFPDGRLPAFPDVGKRQENWCSTTECGFPSLFDPST